MKFKCGKLQIANSLSNVQKFVAQKSTIPALEGILINCANSTIELCGYNMEMGITTSISANIQEEGRVVVNAHLFTDIIKKLSTDTVEISVDKSLNIQITGGESKFELTGIDAEEFPELPSIQKSESLELPIETLRSMIKQTLFAVSDNDSKPVHTGTLFEIREKSITLVSVDGYRLALRTEPIQEELELKFVVPGKTLKEVLRLLPADKENEASVKISAGMRHIIFYIGEYSIISRLLNAGEFLDYQTTIPEKSAHKTTVSTIDLINSIERVSLLITDRLKSPIRFRFSSDSINLSCTTAIGKSTDKVQATSDLNENIETAFNNKYILEALKNSDCDKVDIHINRVLDPIKILPREGNSFLFLVLPVRMRAE